MSQSPPRTSHPGGFDRRDRRLSIIQDTAADERDDAETHALDDNSPSPNHATAMKSYMDAHSPHEESAHQCSPPSPLMSRSNSVVAGEQATPRGNKGEEIEARPESAADPPHSEVEAENARASKPAIDLSKEL